MILCEDFSHRVMELKYVTISEGTPASPSYGISLLIGGMPQQTIPGITNRKADADALAALLNELEVEPCHFEDVIEDFMTDFSI